MDAMSQMYGAALPRKIYERDITVLTDGEEETTKTIVYGCETEKRNEFTASLPKTLDGLELQNVSDNVSGPITEITVEYKTPSTDEDTEGGEDLAWWSSDGTSRIYHVRRVMPKTTAATLEFTRYASAPMNGMSPQGCSISTAGKKYIGEASWKDVSEQQAGAETGTGTATDGSTVTTHIVSSGFSTATSVGAVTITGEVLAALNCVVNKGIIEKVKPYAADINSGALTYGTDYSSGEQGWYYANSSPIKRGVKVDLPAKARQIAAYLDSTISVPVPVVTLSVKQSVYSGKRLNLGEAITAGAGQESDEISVGGGVLAAPQFNVAGFSGVLLEGAQINVQTKWVKIGGSVENVSGMVRNFNGELMAYGEYTTTYQTSTTVTNS